MRRAECLMVSADVQSYVVTFLLFALQCAGHTYLSYMGAFLEEYLVATFSNLSLFLNNWVLCMYYPHIGSREWNKFFGTTRYSEAFSEVCCLLQSAQFIADRIYICIVY